MLNLKICAMKLSKKTDSVSDILKKDPYNEEANYTLAYDYFQDKDYEKAIVHLENLEDPEPIASSNFLRTNLLIFYCYQQLNREDLSEKLFKDKHIELDAEVLIKLKDEFYFPTHKKFNIAFEETIIKEYLILKILIATNERVLNDPFYDTLSEFNIAFGKPAVNRQELLATKKSLYDNGFLLLLSLYAKLEHFIKTNSYSLIIRTIDIIYKTLPEEIKEFEVSNEHVIMANRDHFEFLLGNAYLNLNDYDNAKIHLLKAQELDPKSLKTKKLLNNLLLR